MNDEPTFAERVKKMREETGYGLQTCKQIIRKADRERALLDLRDSLSGRLTLDVGHLRKLLDILLDAEKDDDAWARMHDGV